MWTELVSAFLAAPLWAQAGVTVFLVAAAVAATAPARRRRYYGKKFEDLAAGLGASITRGRDHWPMSFPIEAAGRSFEVVYDFRSSHRSGSYSYRGPIGHLIFCSTPLRSGRWELHGVDIQPGMSYSARIQGATPTGDAAFDAEYRVKQDGVPVRDGWLDGPTRAAVRAFYTATRADGPIWVSEQHLKHVVPPPWAHVDAPTFRQWLAALGALADAFDRTAGGR